MVARITSGKDIIGLLNYNEMKVAEGNAKLLVGNSIIGDLDDISSVTFRQKVESFERNLSLNSRIEKPTFHVSLNPDPQDVLTDDQLMDLGRQYMTDMGYGNQPYLVYKHEDLERHHIHIVSIRVDQHGKKVNSDFEKKRSLTAIQKIEQEYNLIKVSEKNNPSQESQVLSPMNYGKDATRQSISSIVKKIAEHYHFQSLAEYNTILREFNVTVDHLQGEYKSGARHGAYEGLVYSALNKEGQRVGVPTKSSQIGKNVGLTWLQEKFKTSPTSIDRNFLKRKVSQKLRSILLAHHSIKKEDFAEQLRDKGVSVTFRQNEQGRLYGVSFIDHQYKVIFNGSQLGKAYAANQLAPIFSAITWTKNQERSLQKKLQLHCNHIRKTNPRYFLESALIKDLPNQSIALTELLQQTGMQLNESLMAGAVDRFILAQMERLPRLQAKEKEIFEKNARVVIDIINKNSGLAFVDKLRFLYANQVSIMKDGDKLSAVHSKDNSIAFDLTRQEFNKFFSTPQQEGTVSIKTTAIPAYTRTETQFIRSLAAPSVNLSSFQPWNVRMKLIAPFLSEMDSELLFKKLNQNHLQHILQNMDGLPPQKIVSNLLERGMIIYPMAGKQGKVESYRLGFYEYPLSGSVPVSADLARVIFESGYTMQTAQKVNGLLFKRTAEGNKPTVQYRAVVQLKQALDRNDFNQTKNTLRLIEKINKKFTLEILKAIEMESRQLNEKTEADRPEIERKITQKVSHLIASYGNSALRPDLKDIPLETKQEGKGLKTVLNAADTLFSSLWTTSEPTKPEDYKQEKKRKKRRRQKL